jgi:2-keto-3-deoxy-L-rhamnonate aldolase RhmA
MLQAVAAIEAAAGRHDVPMGIFAGSAESAETARAKGYRYIVVGSDLTMLSAGAAALLGR